MAPFGWLDESALKSDVVSQMMVMRSSSKNLASAGAEKRTSLGIWTTQPPFSRAPQSSKVMASKASLSYPVVWPEGNKTGVTDKTWNAPVRDFDTLGSPRRSLPGVPELNCV
jgi:hypothetical protein